MTSAPDQSLLPVLLDALRAKGRITFVLTGDLGDHCGLTNLDEGIVFLDEANTDGEMHATLGHELYHLVCPECPDHEIEQMAAELLVPLPDALAAQASGDLRGTADRLMVDVPLIKARLRAAPTAVEVADGVG